MSKVTGLAQTQLTRPIRSPPSLVEANETPAVFIVRLAEQAHGAASVPLPYRC